MFKRNRDLWEIYTIPVSFIYLLGSIVKSIHGASLISTELINNFELISNATNVLKTSSFHPKIALLINQILSSKKRALPTCIRPNIDIRLSKTAPIKFPHIITYLEIMYGKNQYTHHVLCFYREVPFRVHHSVDNQVDDSALIYSDESNNFHIGMIVGIIQLKTTGEIKFIIDEAEVLGCDSFSMNGVEYINELFIYAQRPTPPRTVSINYDAIREKVAYRKDKYLHSFCEFYSFPNLLEST